MFSLSCQSGEQTKSGRATTRVLETG